MGTPHLGKLYLLECKGNGSPLTPIHANGLIAVALTWFLRLMFHFINFCIINHPPNLES